MRYTGRVPPALRRPRKKRIRQAAFSAHTTAESLQKRFDLFFLHCVIFILFAGISAHALPMETF
jgi:hypothetical protein